MVAVNEPVPVTANEHDCFQELKPYRFSHGGRVHLVVAMRAPGDITLHCDAKFTQVGDELVVGLTRQHLDQLVAVEELVVLDEEELFGQCCAHRGDVVR